MINAMPPSISEPSGVTIVIGFVPAVRLSSLTTTGVPTSADDGSVTISPPTVIAVLASSVFAPAIVVGPAPAATRAMGVPGGPAGPAGPAGPGGPGTGGP